MYLNENINYAFESRKKFVLVKYYKLGNVFYKFIKTVIIYLFLLNYDFI